MACKDCFQNCATLVQDKCVPYTGPSIPLLGICTGDPLSKLEEILIAKLLSALDGTGITLEDLDLTTCPWLENLFEGKDKTLVNLVQLLYDSQCTLKQLIDNLTPEPQVFDTSCLEDLPANPTITDVVQHSLFKLCQLAAEVALFPTTYVKLSDLKTLVLNIINGDDEGGGGSPPIVEYKNFMVPYVALEYYGPLSNFDNTGKGVAAAGFDKVYLCNGQNGTPDRRGRVGVGAVKNVPGGALDAAVDPLSPSNAIANVNYALGDKFGANFHPLIASENGPHTHTINDPGHDHSLTYGRDEGGNKNGNGWMKWDSDGFSKKVTKSITGITINASGTGQPHNNRQPSIAANYIMYIP